MSTNTKKLILHIDEAGRGLESLGPMVLAGVIKEEGAEKELTDIGVKDSKLLSAKVREKLFPKIEKIAKSKIFIEVSPQEIVPPDSAVLNNLNVLWWLT